MARPRLPPALPACLFASVAAMFTGACTRTEPAPGVAPLSATPPVATAPAAAPAAAAEALDPLPDPRDTVKTSIRKFLALQR